MTGRFDRPPSEPDVLDQLARAAASGISRRQLAKLGGALALSVLLPRWPAPAQAAQSVIAHAKTTGPCPPQNAGTCPGARLSWTPDCKHPVATGRASEFNGCGPQSGLDLPILGHGDWIPDRPLYLANFFDACKGHDCCYGQCGSDKTDCDTEFFKAMIKACGGGAGLGRPVLDVFAGVGLVACLEVANAYHAAVHYTQTGQDAYNSGQQEVCECCCDGTCNPPCTDGKCNPKTCECVVTA